MNVTCASDIIFAVSMFVFGIIAIELWDTKMPVWALVLALLICTYKFSCSEIQLTDVAASLLLRDSNRHDPGYNESADWAQRNHRTHRWVRSSGKTDMHDAVQDVRLYYYGAGITIQLR